MENTWKAVIGSAVALALAACTATMVEGQEAGAKPTALGYTQLEGVLTCTLEPPQPSGDMRIDGRRRRDYEARLDRIVRLDIRDEGRTAVLSTPLAPTSEPYNLVFVANRNVFNMFMEENTFSSSVYAVSRGLPEGPFVLGELIHMSAAGGGFARRYECSWVPR